MTFTIEYQYPSISLTDAENLLLTLPDGTVIHVRDMSHVQMYALCAWLLRERKIFWSRLKQERFDDIFGRYYAILELKRAKIALPVVEE